MAVNDLNDLEALKTAFNNLGNTLAELEECAQAETAECQPHPVVLARIVRELITGLRTIFPATVEPWRSVGEIATTEVIPQLAAKMANPDHNSPNS